MTDDTDQLMTLAASGDLGAKQRLLLLHRERLKRMVAARIDRRLRARVDPSDVVQEALITVHARLSDYLRERPVAFYPWLRNIAWEHLLKLHDKHLHTKKRDVKREIPLQAEMSDQSISLLANRLVANVSSPSARMVRSEMNARVRHAIAALKPRDREIIELIYLEQLKPREVADVLGLSQPVVWTKHMRAIQRLSRLLEDARGEYHHD